MTFAVVFPGQGSQSVGMLKALSEDHPEVLETFQESADILGQDLWVLTQQGPAEALADTRVTQPLMFTADVAVWRVLRKSGLPMPAIFAGHSLGEFAALHASGALAFTDGLRLVQERARLMANAVPAGEGGMAALIGMDDESVVQLCQEVTGTRISEAVNFNAPGQVAISGHKDALEATVNLAKERGCRKAVMLPVSVPNHSSLMRDAGASLATTIDSIAWQDTEVPVVQNATAQPAPDLDTMLTRLKAHVYSPVYWTRTIEYLRDQRGVTLIIEAGPGKVLSGLGKRIDRQLSTMPVESPETLEAAMAAVPKQ